MKKFELTAESKMNWFGRTLYRIKACVSFTTTTGDEVNVGDLGGWVEKEQNLSHEGKAWVCGDAKVWGNAKVWGDAKVWGNAKVCGDAKVWGNAKVCGDAFITSPDHIFNVTPIGEDANSLTLFRTKNHEICISFEWDLFSIEGFVSYINNWSEKKKAVALAAIDVAKMHIDLEGSKENPIVLTKEVAMNIGLSEEDYTKLIEKFGGCIINLADEEHKGLGDE